MAVLRDIFQSKKYKDIISCFGRFHRMKFSYCIFEKGLLR